MKNWHSKVMTIANRLVAHGYNRPHAMMKAWALVKLPKLETKVLGRHLRQPSEGHRASIWYTKSLPTEGRSS